MVKAKGLGTLMVIAAMVAILWSLGLVKNPTKQETGKEDRRIVASAIWTISPRPDGVRIKVTGGGTTLHDEVHKVAPFSKLFKVKAGDRVEVRVKVQGDDKANIGCSIAVDGMEAVTEHAEWVQDGFELVCWTAV